MAFTKQHAKQLADLMPEAARDIMRNLGRKNIDNIEQETLDYLTDFDLIRVTTNLLKPGQTVVVLTAKGMKVRNAL
jgi:hypothetical protein